MKLVICEKPSVGAAVAAALGVREKKDGYIEGNGYVISWCIGHLVGLAEAAAYGEQYRKWSYDSLPILPQEWQYTVAADKGKQFKILKDLMQRSRRFGSRERLRRRTRGRIDFPLCLSSSGLQEALYPSLDFLYGNGRHQKRL